MNIKPEDLIIQIGLEAHEAWIGEEVPNRHIGVVKEQYRAAVFILHKPTNLCSYSNDVYSQFKNKENALKTLNELIEENGW